MDVCLDVRASLGTISWMGTVNFGCLVHAIWIGKLKIKWGYNGRIENDGKGV